MGEFNYFIFIYYMVLINSTSDKYAVIIGINYKNTTIELSGCMNDANSIKTFLLEKCNYTNNNVRMLSENSILPTRENIISELNNLVQKAIDENLTELWFSYSGHGSNIVSTTESDNKDEVLVPLDYPTTNNVVTDNELHEIFSRLPSTCNLFSLIDACNSGTVLDLKYVCRLNNDDITFEDHSSSQSTAISANIIKISGSRDEQTSAEDYINGQYRGVLTTYFLECANELSYNCSSEQLIKQLTNKVSELNYTQIPTLTCSNKDILSSLVLRGDLLGASSKSQPEPERKRFRLCSIL
jgi:metacaspase-1